MRNSVNANALYAARWIDQRLHELVIHWQPTMEAISDTHRELASATASDPRDFKWARGALAARIAQMRGDMIHDAEQLLDLRQKITPPAGMFPQTPPAVVAELRRLRQLHDEHLEERYAEEKWFQNALDYHFEGIRCERDGDVLPNPADYDLDPEDYGITDKSKGDADEE